MSNDTAKCAEVERQTMICLNFRDAEHEGLIATMNASVVPRVGEFVVFSEASGIVEAVTHDLRSGYQVNVYVEITEYTYEDEQDA